MFVTFEQPFFAHALVIRIFVARIWALFGERLAFMALRSRIKRMNGWMDGGSTFA